MAKQPYGTSNRYLVYLTTIPKEIKWFFYIAALSILGIEFIGKRYPAINHNFFIIGEIWLRLCYSICAAIIFYFFNQHISKQERKLKTIPILNAKLIEIHMEVVFLVQTLSKDFNQQNFEGISRNWVFEACSLVYPISPVISRESATGFKDWYEYLNYKARRIKEHVNDLLILEDILDPKLMYFVCMIDQKVTGMTSLNVDRKKYMAVDLAYFAGDIWSLMVDSECAIKNRGKSSVKLEKLHHRLFLKNKEGERYFPK